MSHSVEDLWAIPLGPSRRIVTLTYPVPGHAQNPFTDYRLQKAWFRYWELTINRRYPRVIVKASVYIQAWRWMKRTWTHYLEILDL